MSGKLTLETGGGWKRTALLLLASTGITVLIVLPLAQRLPLEGMSRGAVMALLAYAVFRASYGAFSAGIPGRDPVTTVTWVLTEDALTIGDDVIPRESIRQVHCWPNRDSLGYAREGWTVNIETTGKNRLLRTAGEKALADQSTRQLRALVAALGYGSRWPEEPEE